MVLALAQTSVVVNTRLSNKATWTPAYIEGGAFCDRTAGELLINIIYSFILDFIGVLDGIYSNQDILARYDLIFHFNSF